MAGRQGYDAFNDLINKNDGGVFSGFNGIAGDPLREHEAVQWETGIDGVIFQLNCQGCGRQKHFVVEWPEIVALKFGVNPKACFTGSGLVESPIDWVFIIEENAFAPMMVCSNCTPPTRLSLRVAPKDPEDMLKSGRQKGIIQSAGEAQVQNFVAQAKQRGAGIQRVNIKRP